MEDPDGDSFYHQGLKLAYHAMGSGPRTLIVFHGFGQEPMHWFKLLQPFSHEFRIIVPRLFFHGDSTISDKERPISKTQWAEFMAEFLNHLGVNRAVFAGFSMGCRFAITTAETMPERVEKLLLLAPDGIGVHPLFWAATSNSISRALLRRLIFRPKVFFFLVNLLATLKLVDSYLVRFVANNMNTREKRLRVYYSWCNFRDLFIEPLQFARLLNHFHIPVEVFTGQFDKVVHTTPIASLIKHSRQVKHHSMPATHTALPDKVIKHFSTRNIFSLAS